ncbi:uncharacterized protein H6S33_002522 [Morchella sextelata]|uniref:uncharacterized protein n=1 Tax=Morchella sextelata TaxID=1174677 RepID=UPI001D03686D|nr:uncharacterized protein H6S33_002522 [Morchella sextelata]KAH0607488.1 hypothetical protein H6S33_002522 [Morchella sextelata]
MSDTPTTTTAPDDAAPLFFTGPIEAAVATSITQGLPLACFIADDGAASSTWQDEYMQDEEVLPLLRSRCVLLKLQAGSVEAGFLAAFCPIQAVPYLVVVKNGAMVANVAAGVTRDEFMAGIKAALTETETPEAVPAAAAAAAAAAAPAPAPVPVNSPQSAATAAAPTTVAPPQPSTSPAPPSTSSSSARRDSTTPAAAARRGSTTPTPSSSSRRESSAGHLAYLEQQRKRQLAAAEDRKRVLQLLENDKIERRQRASTTTSTAPTPPVSTSTPPPPRSTPSETALSFRLLDGSSLKSRFPSTATLATDVRTWLDAHRTDNSDHPYSFLQILAPSPNKQLSLSDEGSTLLELGLAPTATLVLVPAQSYVSAYNGGGASSEVGILGRAYGLIYGAVATVLGVGYPARAPVVAAAPAAAERGGEREREREGATLGRAGRSEVREGPGGSVSRASSANGRIRTLYDAPEGEGGKEEVGRKYYNGNQLDFEPKRDEKGKERKE